MTKRRVLTSIVTSAVLATVLVLSGCGGSNNGKSVVGGGLESGGTAGGTNEVISGNNNSSDMTGDTADGTGNAGKFTLGGTIRDAQGNETCTTESENCSVTCSLNATSCTTRVEANDKYNSALGIKVLDYLWAHKDDYGYNPQVDMAVYGGTLIVNASGFCSSDSFKVDIKGMKCGKAILHPDGATVAAGFANPGHKVFVLVEIDGQPDQWTTITDTMDESGNFTIDLSGIKVCGGDVKVSLWSIKTGDKSGSTGMSGANS